MWVTIALIFLLFAILRYFSVFQSDGLNNWSLPIGFILKVLVGFYFLYVYTKIYGNGALSADAGAFMRESAILNKVFYTSPIDYFKLLFGLGDQEYLVLKYLGETSHWDAGAQSIISDNRNILRVHSLIQFISRGHPSVHVVIFSFLSTIGIKLIYEAIAIKSLVRKEYIFWSLLLLPSVIFWTSGILKESILFLGIGLFLKGLFRIDNSWKRWAIFILGILLIFNFKPYVLFCAIPAILFFIIHRSMPKHKLMGSAGALMIITAGLFGTSEFIRNKTAEVFSRKQYDFVNVGQGGLHAYGDSCFYFFEAEQIPYLNIENDSVSINRKMTVKIIAPGSIDEPMSTELTPTVEKWFVYFRNDRSDGFIETTPIENSFTQLLLNIPQALKNSLLRPFINDPGSWLKFPATLEVILLFSFLIYALIKRRELDPVDQGLLWAFGIFVLCLSLTIGWVTPVLGAIVRYRIPAFIALLIIGLILIQPSKKRT